MTEEANGNGKRPVLLNRAVVSVSVVVTAITTSVIVTLWITSELRALDDKSRDRNTMTDFRLWIAEARRRNPMIDLPDAVHYELK